AELWKDAELEAGNLADIQLPEHIPAYLPSELLERRPDIRAAESALMAATAQIGVAEALRFPRLNLSALVGTAAASSGDLFSGSAETWNVGAAVTGPIWDFGRTRARVETTEALADQ